MANVGFLYTHIGKRTLNQSTKKYEYTDKKILGRGGISANVNFNTTKASMWEAETEHDKIEQVTGGTFEYTTGIVDDETFVFVTGAKKDEDSGDIICNRDDIAPEVGLCCITKQYNDGVYSYKASFYDRVKFSIPNETYKTSSGELTLESVSLSADFMVDDDGNYRKFKTFTGKTALEDAKAWCDACFTASAGA